MKTRYLSQSFPSLLSAGLLSCLSIASAQPTAFVFNTDGAALPAELTNAINAYGGPGTQIVEFKPGATGTLNGVPVLDKGVVTLPRYDGSLTSSPGAKPEARHFIVAGDLNLTYEQSIWGWGDRLLKIEVLNNANLPGGTLVSVAAQVRLGGAGGGDGGLSEGHPVGNQSITFGDYNGYSAASGGTALSPNGGTGPNGRPSLIYRFGGVVLDPVVYASSSSGHDGTQGQGDGYFINGSQPSVSRGGQAETSSGQYPGGGQGGGGGSGGFVGVFGSPGFPGGVGADGGAGPNGLNGAPGTLMTLAGTAIHLRAGSGGGAGATGGYGVGGCAGGGGGGGGASGWDDHQIQIRPGGNGGTPGIGGRGGVPGLGGNGGGGGGGIQFLVRGVFVNQASFTAAGSNGIPGLAGEDGIAGQAGGAGQPGSHSPIEFSGGDGGNGGNGGKGGNGGHGGNGASGSGGNIQIIASKYEQITGASFNVSGGTGAPAGLVQIHSFSGTAQNAPFGAFAAGASPYRSYRWSQFIPDYPEPVQDPSLVPFLPVEGGAATGGLMLNNFVSEATIGQVQPPANAMAAVVRIPANAWLSNYPNYDLIVFTSVKPGQEVRGPRLSMVNADDVTAKNSIFGNGWIPNGPQWLLLNAGDASNPAFVPGTPGPGTGPIPWNRGFATLVEKGKPFELTAEFGPYDVLRTFKGTPTVATLNPGNFTGSAVLLYDKGRIRSTLLAQTGPSNGTVLSQTELEYNSSLTGEMFARTGTTARVRYTGVNTGNSWSVAQGRYIVHYLVPNGTPNTVDQTYASIAGGQNAYDIGVNARAGSTPNTVAQLADFNLLPDYDAVQQQTITQTIFANVLGPVSTFTGLSPTAGGPGLYFTAPTVQAVSRNIQVTNAAPVRPEWESVAAANPLLTRLGIVSAVITGPDAAAFSVSAPATVERGASGTITVNFTPAAPGSYAATLRVTTDEGVLNSNPGRVIDFPLLALIGVSENYDTWALSLPDGKRGKNDDGDGDGVPNFLAYGLRRGSDTAAAMPWLTRTLLPGGQQSTRMQFDLPELERPDVRWSISGSADMQNWVILARRSGAGAWSLPNPADVLSETLSGGSRRVIFTRQDASNRLYFKLNADTAMSNTYTNDFSTAPRAILLGNAILDAGSLRLTEAENGQTGAAILDMEAWTNQTGFSAAFDLTMGPGTPVPADGISFVVGQTGDYEWGETGPDTARNLTISFDTYQLSTPAISRGFRIQLNGVVVVYKNAQPFTNGASVPVEVTYTPLEGLTLKYNGAAVFTNVAVPGFTLQAGDRFGFGGRTGGYNQVNRVDNVNIGPR